MQAPALENYLENVLYIKLKQTKDKQTEADAKVLETENLIRYLNQKVDLKHEPARYLVDMGAEVFLETEV
ncbi:hypothetical protein GNI_111440 [Gregarina niphandrodes]|uniref:Uncharacterized protein n=1 Tax=Gregarina niphandrodes TaxID=110365 RepID=A0A023B3I8_GRENI|nr:hypothetical protein GNI_111440 [Gregarina niphandrodes]EZG55534.1 hypothetical protein GNI_111440 [Gregarina niphandrodes]|eukprot:XP_011131520.1 hypothetical protein GNI_111440 [Gregarina niphandrodes]